MTSVAGCLVTPVPVTGKALPVVGALQTWLPEVCGIFFIGMAFIAGWYIITWTVMVTSYTAFSHDRHLSMQFVVELHWLIEIGNFIKHKLIRGFIQRVGS
jgi:hypothetical protein